MSVQSNLENAAHGLLMMSESDYPFTYVNTSAHNIDDDLIFQLSGKTTGTQIEKTTLDYLLRNMTDVNSGSVSPQVAQRFQNLLRTLEQQLNNIQVYRIGNVQVTVLILGYKPDGLVAGLKTMLIET